jgi:chorismate dehydratase
MIKISAISYLNTKPFLYGLFQKGIDELTEMSFDIPSVCAQKLISGEVDLGLVPVAVIPQIKNPYIVSDYCIGTEGEVKTVSIFGQKPLEELDSLYLDYHSRTSAALTQILMKEYWKQPKNYIQASEGYIKDIQGNTGGLVIGDRTIGLDFPFVYDLGEAWKDHTGLPFVFAAWVSNKELPHDFIKKFNEALDFGISKINQLVHIVPSPHPSFSIEDYYTKYINYHLTPDKKKALELFLEKVQQLKGISPIIQPTYSSMSE